MTQFRPTAYNPWPTVVKNLLIINGLFYLATLVFAFSFNIDLEAILGLYKIQSPHFRPYQIITHMFMHAAIGPGNDLFEKLIFTHLLFNMFALWMFGTPLENAWGPKRFLTFYMLCGLGAAAVQLTAGSWDLYQINHQISQNAGNPDVLLQLQRLKEQSLDIPTIGASGAIFGVLIGFGMLFPNTELIFLFFPIPVKAKYMVLVYIAIEFVQGVIPNPADNVAHFAHLGGALFGFIIIKIWQRDRKNFY